MRITDIFQLGWGGYGGDDDKGHHGWGGHGGGWGGHGGGWGGHGHKKHGGCDY